MPTRVRLKPGDVIGIPLDEHLAGAGIVLHLSKVFPDAMLVGYFPQTFRSIDEIDMDDLQGPFIATPNYTGKALVTQGPWQVVGHSDALLGAALIPELRVIGDIYYKDEIVRRVPREEWSHYTELAGEGGAFVENKLRRLFGKH